MDKVYFGTPGSFFVSRVVVSKVVTMISPELSQNPLEDPSGILIECVSLLQILHKSTNSKQNKTQTKKIHLCGQRWPCCQKSFSFILFPLRHCCSESLCGWFHLVTEIDVGADVMAKVESNVFVFVYFYFLYLCFCICICVLACDRDWCERGCNGKGNLMYAALQWNALPWQQCNGKWIRPSPADEKSFPPPPRPLS